MLAASRLQSCHALRPLLHSRQIGSAHSEGRLVLQSMVAGKGAKRTPKAASYVAEPSREVIKKADRIFQDLRDVYETVTCPLNYASPFQLLVAVVLSAQVGAGAGVHQLVCDAPRKLYSASLKGSC